MPTAATHFSPPRPATVVRTVLLVEDQVAIRQMLAAFVSTVPGFRVVAECERVEVALKLVEQHHPDVVVLDWMLGHQTGLDFLQAIRGLPAPPAVLVFSGNTDPVTVRAAFAHGARGFIEKTTGVAEFTAALQGVAAGRTSLGPAVSTILQNLVRAPAKARSKSALSPREREILRMVAEGASSREIGERLGIGLRTVNTHRAALIRKTGLHSVAELTRYACEQGMVAVARSPA